MSRVRASAANMKARLVNTRLNVIVGSALLLAGCARFGHQTSESEPHGILRFVSTH